jgi:hypothetical protein
MNEYFTPQPSDNDQAYNLLAAAYSCAYLRDENLKAVPQATPTEMWLKIYQQTSPAPPGRTKPPEPGQFVPISTLRPIEYRLYQAGNHTPLPYQESSVLELWVYDDESNPTPLDQYLKHFQENKGPLGWSIGLSPLARFDTPQGEIDACCLQLDLDGVPSTDLEHLRDAMSNLSSTDNNHPFIQDGFLSQSSKGNTHFHGNAYFPYTPPGQVILANHYGSALLLTKPDGTPTPHARSIGHRLKALNEDQGHLPPRFDFPETSSLRVVSSRIKPTQPTFISFV